MAIPLGYPITAYALCNAIGTTTEDVRAALARGESGLRCAAFFDREHFFGEIASALEPLPRDHAAYEGRQGRLAWQTVSQILPEARSATRRWGPARVAVVVGTSTGGIAATEAAYGRYRASGALPSEFDLERHHGMFATAKLVATAIGSRGPAYAISTACSSSAKVFGCAIRLLDTGLADAVLVGGVDSLCRVTTLGFESLAVLSPDPCRPLSASRHGISLGEGGALALVERRGDARAVLLSVGESNDAHDMSAPHPAGAGAALAMRRALRAAGVAPERIGLINAHATGTELNDRAEAIAIRDTIGDSVPVVATKGYTGHQLGAAGATEVLFTAMSLEDGLIPRSLGSDPIDDTLGLDVVAEPRDVEIELALSNSFAFGGSNASVLLAARDA